MKFSYSDYFPYYRETPMQARYDRRNARVRERG